MEKSLSGNKTKPNRWQNLIKGHCPRCDTKLEEEKKVIGCPNRACDFYITRSKLVEWLTDKKSIVWKNMSKSDRKRVTEIVG